MNKKFIRIFGVIIAAAALAGCQITGTSTSNDTEENVEESMETNVNETTEEVTETTEMMEATGMYASLTDMDGNAIDVTEFEGQKVYLKYWASWCPICLSGLQTADDLFATEQDFVMYTVVTPNKNGEKNEEDFKQWFESLGYSNIKVIFDKDAVLAKELGIRAFPTSVFIDKSGEVRSSRPGHKTNEQIIEEISKL